MHRKQSLFGPLAALVLAVASLPSVSSTDITIANGVYNNVLLGVAAGTQEPDDGAAFLQQLEVYTVVFIMGLLDYAIKIAATWVACKKLHARIARPFTLRIQHRAIFERVSVIGFSTAFR